jgi:hypothetical protein
MNVLTRDGLGFRGRIPVKNAITGYRNTSSSAVNAASRSVIDVEETGFKKSDRG